LPPTAATLPPHCHKKLPPESPWLLPLTMQRVNCQGGEGYLGLSKLCIILYFSVAQYGSNTWAAWAKITEGNFWLPPNCRQLPPWQHWWQFPFAPKWPMNSRKNLHYAKRHYKNFAAVFQPWNQGCSPCCKVFECTYNSSIDPLVDSCHKMQNNFEKPAVFWLKRLHSAE
jgi:hypothetical protein